MLKENYTRLIWDSLLNNWDREAFINYESNSYAYRDVARYVYYLDKLFNKCGIHKGDKISLIGKNSAEWCIAYQSIVTRGSVVVPILPNFTPADVQHLVNHSDSVVLFANKANWNSLGISQMPRLKLVISLDDFSLLFAKDNKHANLFEVFNEKLKKEFPKEKLDRHIIKNQELFAIIYTSGTTGFSKGVMLTHNSITGNMVFARTHLPLVAGDTILSFLPLAHAYGCAIEFLYPFTSGCRITFLGKMPTPELLLKAFETVKPRLILSVPLIFEKIFKKQIKPMLEKSTVKTLLGIPLVSDIIIAKINKKLIKSFGSNFHEVVIGGAALSGELQVFLKKIKFPFTVGYGMTECGPLISYAGWKQMRIGSAGRCVNQLEMKIDSADPENIPGEILVHGENVMKGYYKNKDATHDILDNQGWLHTGDMGLMDKDGFVYIKGRSKSMILSSNGQNIYPEEIESKMNMHHLIQESLVVDRKEGLVALVYPEMADIDKKHINEKALQHTFDLFLKQLNTELPKYMQVSKIEIVSQEFEKTPKRSIKRFLYG
jgi:long-chain acyl-CoA synthetase